MKIIIEFIFFIILAILFYQDIKERKVSLFVLFSGIAIGGVLHFLNQNELVFLSNILINLSFIACIFGILWGYAKLRMKKRIFDVFGQGDLLFFILLGFSLPILSFLMVFVFSLIFSLIVFILLKGRFSNQTVPLAGLQSLFLGLTLIANKLFTSIQLFLS